MVLSVKLLQNKNTHSLIFGVILLVYLYLGTPVPANIILHNSSLIVSIIVSLLLFIYLCSRVNIFLAIIFALVAIEVIRKSLKPDLKDLDKKIQYYNHHDNEVVISDKLKKNNTLEQDMVSHMNSTIGNNFLGQSPRYQPLLADSVGSAQIE
jgi:hypothetical protein